MNTRTGLPRRREAALGLTLLLLACGADAPAEGGAGTQETEAVVDLGEPITASGLVIALPAAWNRLEPRSQMRMLEAEIPGSGGPGEISAYYFGPGGGGGPAANIERWKSQVVLDPSAPAPITQSRESDGVRRTWIELEGTVKASTIGSFPTTDLPDSALYGAIIEAPGGPWYLRAVGPGATMREQRQAFLAMLDNARPEG
ncbi:MAG: hypothetical protein OXG81_13220 [Acidobacteria bacterium]|nr:hypothetical protein [Acidobacteriota bacterium]MCY3966755.1 hypothetical protein [Acidobacteriota bacterium]